MVIACIARLGEGDERGLVELTNFTCSQALAYIAQRKIEDGQEAN